MKNQNVLAVVQASIVLALIGLSFYGVLNTCATTQPMVKAILAASI